jgi:hypothetical protein
MNQKVSLLRLKVVLKAEGRAAPGMRRHEIHIRVALVLVWVLL